MQIIGHRGARNEAPENTLGGFNHLKALCIDAVEFDIRQIHDHNLVVIHDDNTLRTSGHYQNIETCITTDLAQHNHTHLWPQWTQHEITPTLAQVLDIIQNFRHIELEIKAVPSMLHAKQLVNTLQQQLPKNLYDSVVLTSFDTKILQQLQHSNTSFKRGLLIENNPNNAIEQALALQCSQIGWMDTLTTQARVQQSHAAGLKVSVLTVNQPQRAKQLQQWGIDGLITDVPTLMQQYF